MPRWPSLLKGHPGQYPLPNDFPCHLGTVMEGNSSHDGMHGTIEHNLNTRAGQILGLNDEFVS